MKPDPLAIGFVIALLGMFIALGFAYISDAMRRRAIDQVNRLEAELEPARKVCQWVNDELDQKAGTAVYWQDAGKLVIEWLKARGEL